MHVTLRGTGVIRNVFPGKQETINIKIDKPMTVKEILTEKLGIDPGILAAVIVNGQYKKRDYIPSEGDVIILVPPVGGG